MNILLILAATVIVIFLEKQNIKSYWNKIETIVFLVSLSIGASLCMAWVLQVDLINPLEIIANIYRPITEPLTTYMNQFK